MLFFSKLDAAWTSVSKATFTRRMLCIVRVPLGDTSFAQVRALELHVAVLEQLSWRGEEGVLEVLGRIQPHFAHPYKIVREKMARTLVAIVSAVWSPGQGKHASLEDFVDNTVQPLILAGRSAEKDTEAKQNAILAAKTLSMWVVYMSHEGVTQAFQVPWEKTLVDRVWSNGIYRGKHGSAFSRSDIEVSAYFPFPFSRAVEIWKFHISNRHG